MSLFKCYKDYKVVAAELFSSAVCPLKCKYCYIPKTNLMKQLNQELIKELKIGSFIVDLKEIYGENLEALGLWGAEPTITLKLIEKRIPELINNFPKIKTISFSTSLITNPDIILSFVKKLAKENRKIDFQCQISLDGPAFITDINRIKGASKIVPQNLFYLIEKINHLDFKKLKVIFSFKSTLTKDNINLFNKSDSKIKKYFDYFENIFVEYKRKNKNRNLKLIPSSPPSLSVAKYTKVDGENLAKFFKKLRFINQENKEKKYWRHVGESLNVYTYRFKKLIDFQDEIFIKPSMFSCSAGDSNFALNMNKNLNLCHRMFFLSDQNYLDSIISQVNLKNWDVDLFKKGTIDFINSRYNVNIRNTKDIIRMLYVLRNYHDFTRFKISSTVAILKELAIAGQCKKSYLKDDNLAILFALFINSAFCCPAENLLNTGTTYITPVSSIKIFANGAFLEVLKDYEENFGARK